MNDDDYWNSISGSTSATRELYDLLTNYKNYKMYKDYNDYCRKDIDMANTYTSRSGWYQDTRGDEVATAVLEAYAKGIDFETLLKKNIQVRAYWKEIQDKKVKKAQANEREKIRLAKLAEKRAEEKAKREEVMSKLSKEELEAFGLVKKGKR